ncbi:MAG: ATP-dependent DNA ligase [Solirubrobacteraceae bacterium]
MRFGELEPQLARGKPELPLGAEWAYEPKYDGFRAIVFSSPDEELQIQSRGGKELRRYFPELELPDGDFVLDGEIVVERGFGALQQRIHPAASRIQRLAVELPARLIAFDLLEQDGESLLQLPFSERRARLERIAGLELTPLTTDPQAATAWLHSGEGVVAKLVDAPYSPGKRTAMVKIKRVRTIDCVVMGYRPGKEPGTVGSLILGLYEPDGTLRNIGHSSGLSAKRKRELTAELAPYATGEQGSAEPSRWSGPERELEWVALRPELVVEVTFDQVSDGRIRHGTRIVRWRDDKPPQECAISQLDS